MTKTFPLTQVKAHLSEMIDRVEHDHDRIVPTRNGRPAAVLLNPEELSALEDTLDLVSDTEALTEIRHAREEIARGAFIDATSLQAKYESE